MSDSWRVKPLPWEWTRVTAPRILMRDQWRCYRCGRPAREVDHVIPASQGGSDDDSNLAAICYECHVSKTGREGRAAQGFTKRPDEPHPGLLP